MALLRLKRKYVADGEYPFAATLLFHVIEKIGEIGDHYLIYRVRNEHLSQYSDDLVVNVLMTTNKADLSKKSRFFGHRTFYHQGKRIHAAYELIKHASYVNHIRAAIGLEPLPEPEGKCLNFHSPTNQKL